MIIKNKNKKIRVGEGRLNHQPSAWKYYALTIPPHYFQAFFFGIEIYFLPLLREKKVVPNKETNQPTNTQINKQSTNKLMNLVL